MTPIEFRAASVETDPGRALARAMREEIAAMYDGLDLDGEAMPRAGAAELSPPGGAFLVGYRRGEPICCGGLKALPDGPCEIKKMYVVPSARGTGVGRALLKALEQKAVELGYAAARLDTGPKQPGARALYESEGYAEIANF